MNGQMFDGVHKYPRILPFSHSGGIYPGRILKPKLPSEQGTPTYPGISYTAHLSPLPAPLIDWSKSLLKLTEAQKPFPPWPCCSSALCRVSWLLPNWRSVFHFPFGLDESQRELKAKSISLCFPFSFCFCDRHLVHRLRLMLVEGERNHLCVCSSDILIRVQGMKGSTSLSCPSKDGAFPYSLESSVGPSQSAGAAERIVGIIQATEAHLSGVTRLSL